MSNQPWKPDFSGKASRVPGVNKQIKQAEKRQETITGGMFKAVMWTWVIWAIVTVTVVLLVEHKILVIMK